jgi:hypothetical protein
LAALNVTTSPLALLGGSCSVYDLLPEVSTLNVCTSIGFLHPAALSHTVAVTVVDVPGAGAKVTVPVIWPKAVTTVLATEPVPIVTVAVPVPVIGPSVTLTA